MGCAPTRSAMPDAKRPLRPPFFGGPSRRRPPDAPDTLTRELRAVYTVPPEESRYWDTFEARIVAAVRDGAARATATTTGAFRAVPAVAVEWWHALARWAEPGLAAAAIALLIAGAVFVDARTTAADSRAHSAFRDVLDAPLDAPLGALPVGGSVLDAGLARAGDDAPSDDPAEEARVRRNRLVDELLSGGLARRHPSAGERAAERAPDDRVGGDGQQPASNAAVTGQQRDAAFRELLPDE